MKFLFGDFELDEKKHQLIENGRERSVEPQVFEILCLFLNNPDRLISKEELNSSVWKGRVVSDAAVNSRIRSVRSAIGDDGALQKWIKTVHGKGFRFVGDVSVVAPVQPQANENKDKNTLAPNRLLSVKRGLALLASVGVFLVAVWWLNSSFSSPRQAGPAEDVAMSIAVMPFLDLSAAKDLQYIGDGFSEELLNYLAQLNILNVTSRSSAFAFRDSEKSMKEIGDILGVSHLLEGSVRRADDTIRITVQLIAAQDDTHVWSKTFNRKFDPENILAIQEEIAQTIVASISSDFSPKDILTLQFTKSRPAYVAYLRGNELRRRDTRASMMLALEQFNEAIAADPTFARAFAGRAETYRALYRAEYFGEKNISNFAVTARADMDHATLLAPHDTEVLAAACSIALDEGEYDEVLTLSQRLIEKDQNSAAGNEYWGLAKFHLGRYAEAHEALLRARALNPLSSRVLTALGDTKYLLGDIEGAINVAHDNFKWNFDNSSAYELLIFLLRERGEYAEAHRIIIEALKVYPNDLMRRDELVSLYSQLGMREEALAVASTSHLKAWTLAINGERSASLQELERAKNGQNDYELLFRVGEFDKAQRLYESLLKSSGFAELDEMPAARSRDYLAICFLNRKFESGSDSACKQLDKFYAGKNPQDLVNVNNLLVGAGWHLLQGEPSEAMDWLGVVVNRGHVFLNLFHNPVYAGFLEQPGVDKIIDGMRVNANFHKRLIANQKLTLRAQQ